MSFSAGFTQTFGQGLATGLSGGFNAYETSRRLKHDAAQNAIQRAMLQRNFEEQQRLRQEEFARRQLQQEFENQLKVSEYEREQLEQNRFEAARAAMGENDRNLLDLGVKPRPPRAVTGDPDGDQVLKDIKSELSIELSRLNAIDPVLQPDEYNAINQRIDALRGQMDQVIQPRRQAYFNQRAVTQQHDRNMARPAPGRGGGRSAYLRVPTQPAAADQQQPATPELPRRDSGMAPPDQQPQTMAPASEALDRAPAPITQMIQGASRTLPAPTEQAARQALREAMAMAPGAAASQLKQLARQLLYRNGFDPAKPPQAMQPAPGDDGMPVYGTGGF